MPLPTSVHPLRRVLLVDNDRVMVALLRDALEERGYLVSAAFDGLEALEALETDPPDCVILDMVMPKVDGARVCRAIKEDASRRHIGVVLLTGIAAEGEETLRDLGADACIAKREVAKTVEDVAEVLGRLSAGAVVSGRVVGGEGLQPRQMVVELLRENRHLAHLLRVLGEGVLVVDQASRVTYVNGAAARLLGREEAACLGMPLRALLGEAAGGPLEETLRRLARTADGATGDVVLPCRERLIRFTATHLAGSEDGSGAVLVLRDETAILRRIEELSALNELAALFLTAGDQASMLRLVMERLTTLMQVEAGSLLLARPDGQALTFAVALGEKGGLLEGREIPADQGIAGWVYRRGQALVIPDTRNDPRFFSQVDGQTHFETRSMICVPLRTRRRALGVLQVINRLDGAPFSTEDLNLLAAIALHAANAIENLQLIRELREHSERLQDVVRVRTSELETASGYKAQFLANMSHELRTPLNAIIGFSEALEQQLFGSLSPRQARFVGNIAKAGRHLLALVDNLLDLTRAEAGTLTLSARPVVLGEAVEAALETVQARAAAKGIALESAPDPGATAVEADPEKLAQVLLTLLENAVKFTPEGGRVSVSARLTGAQWVEVAVRDTGIGVKAEDAERIFRPFETGDPSASRHYQGAGLGLALCRRLVEMHGGRIWVTSAGEGQGSTFTFTLPLRQGKSPLET
ncbi:MAG: GAF domain-containing protein, partial [candidate division NC10 bacterium]|nr:GAF domain-containing protein [candidate division NC10 bacterium]